MNLIAVLIVLFMILTGFDETHVFRMLLPEIKFACNGD